MARPASMQPTGKFGVAFLTVPLMPRLSSLTRTHHLSRRTACMMSERPSVSRRDFLAAATGLALFLPASAPAVELYEVHKPRLIPQGRPIPLEPPPTFDESNSFAVGGQDTGFLAVDIARGEGEEVKRGTLVLAKWKISLQDGTVIDEKSPSMLRVGAGQVYPGIDAALMGMKGTGSERRIKAPAKTFLSDITVGERSLVPSDATIIASVSIIRTNPYGVQ